MALDGALSHCQLPPSSLPEVGSVRVSMGEGNHNWGPLEPQCGSLSPWLRHTCPPSRIRRSETLSFCLPALWEAPSPEPESWGPSWLLSLRLEGTGAKRITFLLLVMQRKLLRDVRQVLNPFQDSSLWKTAARTFSWAGGDISEHSKGVFCLLSALGDRVTGRIPRSPSLPQQSSLHSVIISLSL